MTDLDLEIVTRLLRENGDDFSTLQLQMNPGYEARDVNLLTEAVLANRTLQEVDFFGILSEDNVNEAVGRLVASFGSLPRLRSLKVSGFCPGLLARLGRVLTQVSSLTTLVLRYIHLDGNFDAFSRALRQNSSLSSFQIIDCQLPEALRDTRMQTMLESLPSSVKEVVLSPINPIVLGTIPVDALTRMIGHTLPHLQTLHVYKFRVLDKCPHVAPLLGALQLSQTIQDLQIQASLSQDNWRSIADLLQTNSSLRCLQIDLPPSASNDEQRKRCEQQILQVGKVLQSYNSSLQEFRTVGGVFSLDAMEKFGKCLEANYTLTKMTPNSLTIHMYTQLNRLGRGKLLQNPSSREDWVAKLGHSQVRGDLNCIYYFLSMNPLLCDLEQAIS